MRKKTRSPNLKDHDIDAIVKIIDGWTGELTWNALINRIEITLYARYTRQALAKRERIQQAFGAYTEKREQVEKPKRRPEVEWLKERVARLQAENQRLEMENNRLLEQFARWAYNAHLQGVDQTVLNRPLPAINRKTEPA